jgi:hypothetical protein
MARTEPTPVLVFGSFADFLVRSLAITQHNQRTAHCFVIVCKQGLNGVYIQLHDMLHCAVVALLLTDHNGTVNTFNLDITNI